MVGLGLLVLTLLVWLALTGTHAEVDADGTGALPRGELGWDGAPGTGVPDAPAAGETAPAPGDVAIAPPPDTFDEAPAPAPPPPAPISRGRFDGVQPAGGTWAVMVGIDDYPGSRSDLRSAVNDANDVDEALARFGVPGDHRLILRNRQAGADIVRLAADWLVAHAGDDATAVFFYAGHVRKLGHGTEAIVAADGQVVSDADLAGHLNGLRARRTWIGIAACYGGGFNELLRPGRVLTAAADANHLAYENEGFRRSYMVQYMVRQAMIQGAAPSSVQSAYAYAKASLDRDYPGRAPVQYDTAGAAVDLRQPGAPQRPASPPPANRSSPPPQPPPSTQPPQQDGCANLTLGVVRCK